MPGFSIYRAYDLVLRSQIAIPGAIEQEGHLPVDAVVETGYIPEFRGDSRSGPYSRSGTKMLFDWPGVARYLCKDGQSVLVEPCESASISAVQGGLVATALPLLLWMRGDLVLHAAGAILPGTGAAVAIAGPSAGGKSTVLRELIGLGASVIGDDTLRLVVNASRPTISGLPAIQWLREGEPTCSTAQGRRIYSVPPQRRIGYAHLDAMLILIRSTDEPAFSEIRGSKAVEAMLRNCHRPRIPVLLGRDVAVFAALAHAARQVRVFYWQRQEGRLKLDDAEKNFIESLTAAGALQPCRGDQV